MALKTKIGMSEHWGSSMVYGESAAWLESMYETYLTDPNSLEEKWRKYFDNLSTPSALSDSASSNSAGKQSTIQ